MSITSRVYFSMCVCVFLCGCYRQDSSHKSSSPLSMSNEIDGRQLQPVCLNDPDSRTMTKAKDELMIVHSANPSKEMRDIIVDIIDATKQRGGSTVSSGEMKGLLETTEIKQNRTTLSPIMVHAALTGPREVLSVSLRGSGSVKEKQAIVQGVLDEWTTTWSRLYKN